MSPIVLTITPPFPIRFPSFRSHSRCLRRLSVAGRVARRQLSSRVSYKVLFCRRRSRVTGVPDKATPFPALPIQKCSASSEPSALSLSLAYSGDSAHQRHRHVNGRGRKGRVTTYSYKGRSHEREREICTDRTGNHYKGPVPTTYPCPQSSS